MILLGNLFVIDMETKMKPLFKSSLAVLAIFISSTVSAETRWNMATPYVDATHHTQNIKQFASDVKEATKGELTIQVHSGGSLIKHKEIARAVRSRQVQMGEIFAGILGNDDPVFKLDNLPFLATDFVQAKKLYDTTKASMQAKLDKDGMILLYSVPWPPQGIYSKQPINTIDDLKGTKMRAYSPMLSRLSVLLGANPTTVQTVEIPQAFSTGIIDVMITSPTTGISSQAWDYVKHYTDVQAWIPKNIVIVNKREFLRLDKATQTALLAVAAKAEARGWEMAKRETTEKTKQLSEMGIIVQQPSVKLMDAFKAVGDTLTAEWKKEAGKKGEAILVEYQKL
jgi:TRAP-type C4-dicarboxylate transport system substrate-binding protein